MDRRDKGRGWCSAQEATSVQIHTNHWSLSPPPPYISTLISIPHTQHEPLLGDWVQKWGLASDIHQKLVLLEDPGMFQEGLKLAMLGRTTNKALF